MNSLALYDLVRDQMRSGDVIAFSGHGPASDLIRWKTNSAYSHVGIVLRKDLEGGLGDSVLIAEADARPTLPDVEHRVVIRGLTVVWLSQKLDGYDGDAWWLQLKQPLTPEELIPAEEWMRERRTRKAKYDYIQATAAGLKLLDKLGQQLAPDFSSLFCSEFAGRFLQLAGRIKPEDNPSDMLPQDIVWQPIFMPPCPILESPRPLVPRMEGK